jgi:RHS repeat-associated protein
VAGAATRGRRRAKSSGEKQKNACKNGHPVDVITGHVVDQATDLALPGPVPLVWKRFYSSARRSDRSATLGPGWAHGFEARLTVDARLITLREGEGRSVWFAALKPGESFFHRRERLTLTCDGPGHYRVASLDTRETMVFAEARLGGPCLLRSVEDAHGNALRLEYEGETLAQIVDSAGRVVALRWAGGRITRLEARSGGSLQQWVDYQYDGQGRLRGAVDALGHTERYEYDGKGRMTAAVVKNGTRFTYTYEPNGSRCVRTGGPGGLYEVAFRADAAAGEVVTASAEPRRYRGNALGLMTRASLPDGTLLEELAYDDDGYLLAKANGAGEGTQYWYDERGNRTRIVDANRNETRFEYENDRLVRRFDPEGVVTDYAYDAKGSLTLARTSHGRWVAFAYDAIGRLVRTDDDAGRSRSFAYDAQHNLVAETDATGATCRYGYDPMGRPVTLTDALGRATRVTCDRLGRRTSLRAPDGAQWQWAYDPMGKVIRETDPLGRTTRFENAGMGVPVRMTTPDGQAWAFTYTPFELLASVQNPRGEVYAFTYDEAGRVVREATFDGRTLGYHYSPAGRVERIDYPDRTSRAFAYDRLGNVTGDETSDGLITLRRDRLGRLVEALLDEARGRTTTRFERDERGRVVAEHHDDATVRYAYDAFDRLVERTLPGGLRTRYAFDAHGALSEVEHAGFALRFERDTLGREVRRGTNAYGIESRYDGADRLLEQEVRVPEPGGGVPAAVVRRRWHYDTSGLVTQLDDARWGSTFYRYGRGGELLEARRGALRETFAYDAAGSLRALTSRLGGAPEAPAALSWGASEGEAQAWERDPGNLVRTTMTARYRYDARARRIGKQAYGDAAAGGEGGETVYVWDGRDRLREVRLPDGRRVTYGYDALGRRVHKRVERADGSVTREQRFVWDGNALALELDSERGRRSFAYRPGSLEPILQEERGEVFAYVNDQVGVPRELVDRAGRVAWAGAFTAFGQLIEQQRDDARGGQVESPFRLLGQVFDDESGLGFAAFRCFDPETGRWLSSDPLGILGGGDLFSWNASPVHATDPLGLANELDLGTMTTLTGRANRNDGMDAHELLQNAWLVEHGVSTGRNSAVGSQNPAIALTTNTRPGAHQTVGQLQAREGLNKPATLAGQSATQNMEQNAQLLEQALVANGVAPNVAKEKVGKLKEETKKFIDTHVPECKR